jgi:hypothetical protein
MCHCFCLGGYYSYASAHVVFGLNQTARYLQATFIVQAVISFDMNQTKLFFIACNSIFSCAFNTSELLNAGL